MNLLQKFFELQAQLNQKIGIPDLTQLDASEQQKWLLRMTRAISQETAELVDCAPWKWWAKYQTFDLQNARVEVIDLLHFLISTMMIVGITPENLMELYEAKHAVNVQRQEAGYTEKTEDCKHIEPAVGLAVANLDGIKTTKLELPSTPEATPEATPEVPPEVTPEVPGCPDHPKYGGERPPRTGCKVCLALYETKKAQRPVKGVASPKAPKVGTPAPTGGCPDHKRYTGQRRARVKCVHCDRIYDELHAATTTPAAKPEAQPAEPATQPVAKPPAPAKPKVVAPPAPVVGTGICPKHTTYTGAKPPPYRCPKCWKHWKTALKAKAT